jgi:5-hydroxyisourate hydrolase
MSAITTHVLDTAAGRPAAGIHVSLEASDGGSAWHEVGRGTTDSDGRASDLLPPDFTLREGAYRLVFYVGLYFVGRGVQGFYTEVVVSFVVRDAGAHYHVPLLLSPYGYTTYRGS